MWQETQRIFVESATEVLHAAARLLPNVLAMLLFFALAAALAIATRVVVRRACERLSVDRHLRAWGVVPPGDAGAPGPSATVARVAFWTVLAAGVVLGVSVLPGAVTSALSLKLLEYAPRLLLAVVILGVALGLSRVIERNALIGAVNMGMQSARLIALGVRWLVVVLGGAIALEYAGLGTTAISIAFGTVFGGIVLALSLAVGLGAKDLVARSLQRRFPEAAEPRRPEERGGQIRHL